MNDERGDKDLEVQIAGYKELIKDMKELKFKILKLESEIIKKDNLIEGLKKVITDLSVK
tara:strand:- start:316 stop:492 length:177 start_codon:yes stop_codon:yes gene_type:complete